MDTGEWVAVAVMAAGWTFMVWVLAWAHGVRWAATHPKAILQALERERDRAEKKRDQ